MEKKRRNYIACVNCRVRKIRCDFKNGEKCTRCERERRECVFVDSKKRTVAKIRKPRTEKEPEISTVTGAFEFLAQAANMATELEPKVAEKSYFQPQRHMDPYSEIVSAEDSEFLVRQFFSTMHPFFPYVPRFLHEPETLAGYPILYRAILTISARYHRPELHERLWQIVQQMLSQTVWAEASTRSLGTVFAFLLFTEWNPRAIHFPGGDYANSAKEEEKGGLGSMRRSYRLAWMLIGSAVRLAQDMGFMDSSPQTFVAIHVAELNSVTSMGRKSMLGQSLQEFQSEQVSYTEFLRNQNQNISEGHSLSEKLTFSQKAHIELLQIISVAHEALHSKNAPLSNLNHSQTLSILNIIAPMLSSWERNHKGLLTTKTADLQQESFCLELSYAKLYVFSLALRPDGGFSEVTRSAKHIETAFHAANDILAIAEAVHNDRRLQYMPVRWTVRIVKAVAFIVKCYLSITSKKVDLSLLSLSSISVESIASNVAKAAVVMRECAPDELHLCARYSNVLMYISAEMRTKLGPEPVKEPVPEPLGLTAESESIEWIFNNDNPGLDFVGPWTELIEQQLSESSFDW